jgi:hypothetical protein
VTTFATDYGPAVVQLARAVEDHGFYSLFFNEHRIFQTVGIALFQ